ncbi:MAG: tripartite tricarboxylate transporter substrate-binding protein [Alphaproteobacteria bacterium]|nr:tripartite tricarboxylate transporter substrate-binding protein [Alphaproteobacteria bacterium]
MLRLVFATLLLAAPAMAQEYPSRPVRVIVSLAPGGNADINARAVSAALSSLMGQQFVVENRPAAGGTVAVADVARAAPDGYTLLVGALGSHVLNVGLYRNQPVNPITDLAHITISSESAMVVAAHPSLGVRNLAEFRTALAARPGQVPFGSSGNGTTGHIAGMLLLHTLGVTAQHVPYRGSAPAFVDLSAGRMMFQTDTISFLQEHIRAGTVVGIVNGGAARSATLPDLPTGAEAGIPGFVATTWTPWSAPAGTPPAILELLSARIRQVLAEGPVRERLLGLGNTIPPDMTPARTTAFIRAEADKWLPVVRATGASLD